MSNQEFQGEGAETWEQLSVLVSRGHSEGRVFDDFLDVTLYTFDRKNAAESHYEKEYMAIVGRYQDERKEGERNVDIFAKAIGALILEMRKSGADCLGNIFEQCITHGRNGQFLTPESVCELLTALTIPDFKEDERIADPACGSGRMLLAAGKKNPHGFFFGKDIDSRCAKMTALNLLFFNLTGLVEHGDSINDTLYAVWMTKRTAFGGILHQLNPTEFEEYRQKKADAQKMAAKAEPKPVNQEEEDAPLFTAAPDEALVKPTAEEGTAHKIEEVYTDLPLFAGLK